MSCAHLPAAYVWASANYCVVTPDDDLLYLSYRAVCHITAPQGKDVSASVQLFQLPLKPIAIDVDPNWGRPNKDHSDFPTGKYFAIGLANKSVEIWDFEKQAAICAHNAHKRDDDNDSFFIKYACDGNLVSVDRHNITVHCLSSNSYICRSLAKLTLKRQHVTSLCCSPNDPHIIALGTNDGQVLICDLKFMHVLHKLCDQTKMIMCIDWLIRPVTVAAKEAVQASERISPKKALLSEINKTDDDDTFDIYSFDQASQDFGAPTTAQIKSETEYYDCTEHAASAGHAEQLNFVEVCEYVKQGDKKAQESTLDAAAKDIEAAVFNEVTLEDCNKFKDENPLDDGSFEDSFTDQFNNCNLADSLSSHSKDSTEQHERTLGRAQCQGYRQGQHHRFVHHQAVVHTESSRNEDSASKNTTLEETTGVDQTVTLLLALSSDGSFRLWNAAKAMLCDKISTTKVSSASPGGNRKIAWKAWNKFYVVRGKYDLSSWSILPDSNDINKYSFAAAEQLQLASDVRSFANYLGSDNIWIMKRDISIVCQHVKTTQACLAYDSVPMNIKCISPCPADMNKILLISAGHQACIWDLSNFTEERISVKRLRVPSETLLSACWNTDGTKIAFGTRYGDVIVYDVENEHLTNNFKKIYSEDAHTLLWKDSWIIANGRMKLLVYDTKSPKLDPIIINTDSMTASALAKYEDFLLMGNSRGELCLFVCNWNTDLKVRCVHKLLVSSRNLNNIEWCITQPNRMCVTSKSAIAIVDLDPDSARLSAIRIVDLSKKYILVCAKWNHANQLVTSNDNGSIDIWNILDTSTNEPILTKTVNRPVFYATFLPTDEDIVAYSGKSISVSMFSIKAETEASQQLQKQQKLPNNAQVTPKFATEAMDMSTLKSKSNRKERLRTKRAKNGQQQQEPKQNCIDVTPNSDLSSFEHVDECHTLPEEEFKITAAQPAQKIDEENSFADSQGSEFLRGSTITLLTLTRNELNKTALQKLKIVLEGDAQAIQESVLCSKFFSTSAAAKELLTAELNNTKLSRSKPFDTILTAQMNCSLEEEIQNCIKQRKLTEWHVSLAPSVSQKFWSDCCLAYADQLAAEGHIMQAVSYLIAVRSKEKAIIMLRREKYYSEALLLARIFLKATSALFSTIVNEWVDHLEFTGQLGAAALICVLNNDNNRAFHIVHKISKWNNEAVEILKTLSKLVNPEISGLAEEDPI